MPFSFEDSENKKNMVIFNYVIEFQNQLINMINNNFRDDSNINNPAFNNLYNFGMIQNTYVNKNGRKAIKDDSESNSEIKKEFVKYLIDRMSPFCFITHYFNTYFSNNKEIIDFFMNNYDNKFDKIIIVSNNSEYNEKIFLEIKNNLNLNGVTFENYVLDYRINTENLNKIINDINPKFQLESNITGEYKEINLMYNQTFIDKNLSYNNCYLLSNNDKDILNQLSNNSELDLEFSKEQLRYNITLKKQKNCKNIINETESKSKKGRKKKGNDNKEENKIIIL